MINYNIINEFIEKLKAGKTTASDINAIAEAYKNGELTNTVNLIEVENIKAIPSSVLEDLNCGDIVVKNENGNKHAYVVTYKEHHQGICLTYIDASMCETQSYDYVTDTWTYNSQDTFTFINYTAGNAIDITDGVISGAYTAGQGINIEGAEISAAAGEVWESKVNFNVTSGSPAQILSVRLFTKEEVTNDNVKDIVNAELNDYKTLPCFSDAVTITVSGQRYLPIHLQIRSGQFLVQTLSTSFERNGIYGTVAPASATYSVDYSHKIN